MVGRVQALESWRALVSHLFRQVEGLAILPHSL
jgi:hypothetical protein